MQEVKTIPLINRYFDKIIFINSKKRMDRYANMNRRIRSLGIEAERFEAILGGHILPKDLIFGNIKKKLNNGEIGCFQSHRRVWELAKKKGWKRTLILEDDALFYFERQKNHHVKSANEFHKQFEQLIKNVPEFDLLYFGQHNYDKGVHPKGDSVALGEKLTKFEELNVYKADRCWLTHAYAVNIDCIDYLLENTKIMYSCLDNVMADIQNKLRVYAIYPNLIHQDNTKSSLR